MHSKEKNPVPDNLISGYLTGELTPEEKKELLNWIRSDPGNKRLFDEYCEIWITTQAGVKHPEFNFHEGFWKFKQKIKGTDQQEKIRNQSGLFRQFLKYAAIVFIAVSASGLFFFNKGKNQIKNRGQSINELIVPMGSSASFRLSDGTFVTLNAGSSLKYDNCYGIYDRVVNLEGEAFFDVAKETDMPFTVKTSHLSVLALGTTFNVKAYSDDKTIETTLVEGSVRIEGISAEGTRQVTVLKPNQKMTFFKEDSTIFDETASPERKPGINVQQVQVQKLNMIPRAVTENVNVEPVISWKENKWIFEKQSLEKIAVELERKFDVRIMFETERLKTFRFTGTILAEPIEQVLEFMSLSAPINFNLKGKIVTLSENKNFEELNKLLYDQQQ